MIAGTKKTRVLLHESVNAVARRGGAVKATRRKSKAGGGESVAVAEKTGAAPAKSKARGRHCVAESADASRAGDGDNSSGNDVTCASPAETNGHAVHCLNPSDRMRAKKRTRASHDVMASEPLSASAETNGGGDWSNDAADGVAAPVRTKGRAIRELNPIAEVHGPADGGVLASEPGDGIAAICQSLQQLQRRRSAAIKVKNMGLNQLAAIVSTELGYRAGLDEAERKAKRAEAEKLIKRVDAGDDPFRGDDITHVAGIILLSRDSRKGMETYIDGLEKEMLVLAKQLPVAAWVEHADRRGVGLLSLATIIGETGDLSNYDGPAKVWKRMGCAPITSSAGDTRMGSTWKMKGGLSAEEWTSAGYSPRKRAIMFCIGECINKLNCTFDKTGDEPVLSWCGPYRKRYDETKAAKIAAGWEKARAHKHGMLMAVKLLLKELWIEWRGPSSITLKP